MLFFAYRTIHSLWTPIGIISRSLWFHMTHAGTHTNYYWNHVLSGHHPTWLRGSPTHHPTIAGKPSPGRSTAQTPTIPGSWIAGLQESNKSLKLLGMGPHGARGSKVWKNRPSPVRNDQNQGRISWMSLGKLRRSQGKIVTHLPAK